MSIETINVEIPANKPTSYPIIIGNNILKKIGHAIKEYTKAKKLLIVTNKTIYPIFKDEVISSLEQAGFELEVLILEDGEKCKNIDSLQAIWNKALEYKLERKDAIVALGGGVVGDISGFAAASYLRGIDFIQVPTTLLAQVDSSVGGKVAINNDFGKNLIGAFYQPKLVYADIKTLKTLPERELKVGLAEVLKYGFIEKTCQLKESQNNFIEFLQNNKDNIYSLNQETMINLVKHCCRLKAAVVNQDEKEVGLRTVLNFGHTIGHAIEKCSNYQVFNHGEAVAIGMKGAFSLALQKGLISENYYNESISLIKDYKLDYKIQESMSTKSLLEAMSLDKKVQSGKVRFVLSTNKGEVSIFNDVTDEQITITLSCFD